MKSRKLNKTRMILILILCAVTVGFALLFSDLRINGIGHILAPKWNIHWDSNSVAVSSKSVDGEVEVNDKEDEVDFTANLHVPGDVYEFTIDAVNEGTIDGMITIVNTTFYNENDEEIERPYYIDFDITNEDDSQLSPYQELNANTSKTYKVRLSYSKNINNEDLPSNPIQFKTKITIDYEKKDDRSTTVEPYVRNLCNNTLVYNETTTFKANKVEDLVCLSQKVNSGTSFSGKTINLEKNIDFTERNDYVKSRDTSYGDINDNGEIEELITELATGKGFKPIGNNSKPFSGTFIGNAYKISNVKIIRPEENYVGLFGYNSGTIQTIEVENIEVEGNNAVGGIAGGNSGTLIEMKFDTKVEGNNQIGGVVGNQAGGNFNNGVGKSIVSGTGSNVGGVIGTSGYYSLGGFILESGSSSDRTFVGTNYISTDRVYYFDGYSATTLQGIQVDKTEKNISMYENAIDTWIGGDNDDTGYYFILDENNEPQLVKVADYPITFTLEGSGTESDPYLIHNPQEWKEATSKVQQAGIFFKLANDIDFTGEDFYKLGSPQNTFKGTLDGNNKTLRGIEIRGGAYTGIIGYKTISSEVKDLNVEDSKIVKSGIQTGMISGYSQGKIKHIKAKNIQVSGTNKVGGITGENGNSSYVQTIEVENVKVKGNNNVGGIVGYNNATVTEMKFDTKVEGATNVGGVVGKNMSTVTNGVGSVEVEGTNTVGGISGDTSLRTTSGFIIESGSSTGNGIGSYGESNWYYFDGYSATTLQGIQVDKTEKNISMYENAIDTWIGGDNDDTGYYFILDENNEPQLVKVADYPITFTLEGSGTESDPYLIHNPQEWKEATSKVQQAGIFFKLANDIDFTGEDFYKLGSPQNTFKGTLDGNNKTLRGIEIRGGAYTGIIGYKTISSEVKDLNVEDSKIVKSGIQTGMISGYSQGKIKHIKAKNIQVSGTNKVGGITGENGNSSYVQTIEVENVKVKGNNNVGGIVGYNNATVTEMKFDTKVEGATNVGGVVGKNMSTVTNGVGSVEVEGTNTVGGISGDTSLRTTSGFIIESGSSTGNGIGSYGESNWYYFDGYSATTLQGIQVDKTEKNISMYENAIDTWIGGDNDDTGYYFILDENNEPQLVKVADYPITFTLEGSGTESDPYLIHNPQEWKEATSKVQQAGIFFKLANDIDFTGEDFYKLGSPQNTFKGTLDGNNKTLRGIEIRGGAYTGIIGYKTISSEVKDLNVEDSKIVKSGIQTGMISGYSQGKIKHIKAKNIQVSGTNKVGGITGENGNSSYVQTIEVENVKVKGNNNVGGIVGYNNATVTEMKFDTKVEGATNVGGVVGKNMSTVTNGVGSVEVEGTNTVGGISGDTYLRTTSGFIIESGSSTGRGIGSYGESNWYYFDGYSATTLQGIQVDKTEKNISMYENAIDTWIGGDNDDTGYYFILDENNEPQLVKVADYPITFTLEGSGTESDPYLIHNPQEWKEATSKVQQAGIFFKLANDIDFTGEDFYKLGSPQNTFKGTLDGNNKTLRGIEIRGGAYTGIIGYKTISSEVKDLNVEDSKIVKSGIQTGMISGYSQGKIKHIKAKNIQVSGTNTVGGITGENGNSSYVQTIEVENVKVKGNNNVGGIVGYNNATVTEMKFDTKVEGATNVGGVVGKNMSTVTNGVGSVEVEGTNTVGGISGDTYLRTTSGFIIESGSSTGRGIGSYGESNWYYFDGYSATTLQGTQWPTSYLHDLEQYSTVVETPLTGDTDGTGYIFDYILGDGEIHLVPVHDYTGWKLMNNISPMTSQKWAYFDDTTHERITSGWHELYDLYNNLQWYYFENGYAKTGWLELDGKKYYLSTFDPDGNGYIDCNRIHDASMMIDEVLYTFDSDGVCTNCS